MSEKFELAKVTSKGQITIPKAVREHLGVEPGDHVAFVTEPGGTVRICLPSIAYLDAARDAFQSSESVRAEGLETVDDVVAMIKEMRAAGDL